jgi:hypothetical protein
MSIFPFAFGENGDAGYYCWLNIFGSITNNTIFAII